MNKFIQGIIAFSLKNRGFVFLLTLAAIIAGVVSYRNTPIEASSRSGPAARPRRLRSS
jgi:cobalt-zinc-cadmium resistance protein CzcA